MAVLANCEQVVAQYEQKYGLPRGLLYALVRLESGCRTDAVNSRTGASGLTQIIPRYHPGVNPFDPNSALDYTARYLRDQYAKFGRWALAVGTWQAGPGAIERKAPCLPNRSDGNLTVTQYVQRILSAAGIPFDADCQSPTGPAPGGSPPTGGFPNGPVGYSRAGGVEAGPAFLATRKFIVLGVAAILLLVGLFRAK